MEIVGEYVEIPEDGIDGDTSLKLSAGMDSFVLLSMVAAVEEHFNIRIPNESLADLKTLNDFTVLINSLINA